MMAKVVKFPVSPPAKLGHHKAKKRRKKDPEDFGQLNLFKQVGTATVRSIEGESFFDEALKLDEAGKTEEAIKLYLKAVDAKQALADAHCNLGIIFSKDNDFPKAVDHLSKCLKTNPRHFEAHYNLGNVYSDMGNFPLARLHYEIAIEIEPSFSNSHYNLALVLISLKEYHEAQRTLQKYIELSPGFDHGVAQDLIKTLNTFN